jgi:hypothetical protein
MLQQITPRTHRNLTTSKKGLKGRLLFFLRADTPRDKTTNKVILLNFRPTWAEFHFGPSGLWLLWSGHPERLVRGMGMGMTYFPSLSLCKNSSPNGTSRNCYLVFLSSTLEQKEIHGSECKGTVCQRLEDRCIHLSPLNP